MRQANIQRVALNGCMRNLLEVGQPECATGDTASTTTVALVGDSTAALWNPAFEQVAAQRRWRLETLSKGACPLLDLRLFNATFRREYTECEQWRDQITARLKTEHPRLVVLSIRRVYRRSKFHAVRPGVDPQPDPPCAAAARYWCAGARARADTGSAHVSADLPVRPPR